MSATIASSVDPNRGESSIAAARQSWLLQREERELGELKQKQQLPTAVSGLKSLDVQAQEFVSDYLQTGQEEGGDIFGGIASDAVVPRPDPRLASMKSGQRASTAALTSVQQVPVNKALQVSSSKISQVPLKRATQAVNREAAKGRMEAWPGGVAVAGAAAGMKTTQLLHTSGAEQMLCEGVLEGFAPSMPMVYGSNPMAYPGQALPQAPLPLGVSPVMSPAALARLQRASADIKRGKRRRRPNEAPAAAEGVDPGGDSSGGAAPALTSTASVPALRPPVVKVKEERRKKRLLRNRVSAQQARERKRQHVTELEEQCTKWEQQNVELEQRAAQLTKENEELRLLVKGNMRANVGNGASSSGAATGATILDPDFSTSFPSLPANVDSGYHALSPPLPFQGASSDLKPISSYHHPLSIVAQGDSGGTGLGLDPVWDSRQPQSGYGDDGGVRVYPAPFSTNSQFVSMF